MSIANFIMSQREIFSVGPMSGRSSKAMKKKPACLNCDEHATTEVVFMLPEQDILVTERYCNDCANAIVAESKASQ
jgi:hypothetical protein